MSTKINTVYTVCFCCYNSNEHSFASNINNNIITLGIRLSFRVSFLFSKFFLVSSSTQKSCFPNIFKFSIYFFEKTTWPFTPCNTFMFYKVIITYQNIVYVFYFILGSLSDLKTLFMEISNWCIWGNFFQLWMMKILT